MTDLSGLLLPLLLLLLVAFMFWSQRRRQRAALVLQASLEVGDEVCTTSGLYGVIRALDDSVAHLEVAPGTVVRFDRRAVTPAVASAPRTQTAAPYDAPAAPDAPAGSPSPPAPPTSPIDEK